MRTSRIPFTGLLILFGLSAVNTALAEEFNWILNSISKLDYVDNGNGHKWKFMKTSGGNWEVEGANFEKANVTSAGESRISIGGFPHSWGANGTYVFTKNSDQCNLKSEDSSTHELKWGC